jgi:hypothetical protein
MGSERGFSGQEGIKSGWIGSVSCMFAAFRRFGASRDNRERSDGLGTCPDSNPSSVYVYQLIPFKEGE